MDIAIPDILRDHLKDQVLPFWVCDIFGYSRQTKFGDLPPVIKANSEAELKAINHYLESLLNRKMRENFLDTKHCFPDSNIILDKLLLNSLDLSFRTKRCLFTWWATKYEKLPLSKLTYGDLFRTPNMGVRSVLEFLRQANKYQVKNRIESSEDVNESILSEKVQNNINILNKIDDIDLISKGDPRFPEMNIILPYFGNDQYNSLSDILVHSYENFSSWPYDVIRRFNDNIETTVQRIHKLNSLSLEIQFKHLISTVHKGNKKNLPYICERFGINNKGTKTLEECGKLAGLTRERIRQIESKIIGKIKAIPGTYPVYMPKLNNAIDIIRKNIYSSVDEIQSIFIKNGISEIGVSVDSVLYFGKLLRYEVSDLKVSKGARKDAMKKFIAGVEFEVSFIFTELSRTTSKNGIADLNIIQNMLEEKGIEIEKEKVKRFIEGSKNWHSLDQKKRWWIPVSYKEHRNRLINVARKILSVSETIEVDELRNAYIRLATVRNSSGFYSSKKIQVPSSDAIRSFFEFIDDFIVVENQISSIVDLDYRDELEETERTIAEIFMKSPTDILGRVDLSKQMVKKGMNANTASIYISYSTIIQHVGFNSYSIIGKKPLASEMAAHQDSTDNMFKNKKKRILLHDWHENLLRIVVVVPEVSAGLVVGAPSGFKEMLANRKFEVWNTDETKNYANVGVSDVGAIYGMSSFCQQSGIEAGDVLEMKFNLLEAKVFLRLASIDEFLGYI